MADETEELASLFRRLGAPDPEGWARSQVAEGISQLHRYLFLRQAWKEVVPDGSVDRIDAHMAAAERRPQDPYSGVGHALKRLLADGAKREDLTEVVRGMQAEFLFGFCYLVEDPSFEEEELDHVGRKAPSHREDRYAKTIGRTIRHRLKVGGAEGSAWDRRRDRLTAVAVLPHVRRRGHELSMQSHRVFELSVQSLRRTPQVVGRDQASGLDQTSWLRIDG